MTCAVVASEYADATSILVVVCLSVLFSLLVDRWWTLALPLVVGGAVIALSSIDSCYERTPEDFQAGLLFGAAYGLVLAAAVLLVRRTITHLVRRRRTSQAE